MGVEGAVGDWLAFYCHARNFWNRTHVAKRGPVGVGGGGGGAVLVIGILCAAYRNNNLKGEGGAVDDWLAFYVPPALTVIWRKLFVTGFLLI